MSSKKKKPLGRSLNQPAALPRSREEATAQIEAIVRDVGRTLGPKEPHAAIAAAKQAAAILDVALATAQSSTSERPACTAGCFYCCASLRVDVYAPEVARLVEHVDRALPKVVAQAVKERARKNALRTHGKSALDYPQRLPCALLGEDGRCLAYEARPLACRRHHSKSVELCKAGYAQEKADESIEVERIYALELASSLGLTGMAAAVQETIGDEVPCELQEALHIGFSQPDAVTRWLNGDDAFAPARIDKGPDFEPPLVQLRRR